MPLRVAWALVVTALAACAAFGQEQVRLFYATHEGPDITLWGTDTSGAAPERLSSAFRSPNLMSWSPNGRYYTFVQLAGEPRTLYLFAFDCVARQAMTLSGREGVRGYWWSEDSSRVFYVTGEGSGGLDLYGRELTPGSTPLRLNGPFKAAAEPVVTSADGAYAAFSVVDPSNPRQVAISDLRTGEARSASQGLRVLSHMWCQSGARLAMLVEEPDGSQALYVVEPAGTPRRVSAQGQWVRGFAPQPEGTLITYMTAVPGIATVATPEGSQDVTYSRTQVHLVDTQGGEPVLVPGILDAARFIWSPGGKSFAISDLTRDPAGVIPSIKVGAASELSRAPDFVRSSTGSGIFAWSPDASRLAFIRGDSLFAFDTVARQSRLVVNSLSVREMAWAPDSRRIAIITHYEGQRLVVWVVNADEGKARLVSHAFPGGGVDWSPDGAALLLYIPLSEQDGMLMLLNPRGQPDDAVKLAENVVTASWYPQR